MGDKWIKENIPPGVRVITALKPDGVELIDVTIFHFDEKFNLYEKIFAKKINVKSNEWQLNEVRVFKIKGGAFEKHDYDSYKIKSYGFKFKK